MGRRSKLTEKQWAEIERRISPQGTESMRSVAKEFGVSEGMIRKYANTQMKPVNRLANQIATVEREFENLPLRTQVKVRTIADSIKGIAEHSGAAGEYGAMTAHRLSMLAYNEVQKVDDVNPLESIENLKSVLFMTELANKSSTIGLNLLNANAKSKEPEGKREIVLVNAPEE